MGRRVEETVIKLTTDQSSARRTKKSFEELSRELAEARAESARLNKEASLLKKQLLDGVDVTDQYAKAVLEAEEAEARRVKTQKELRRAIDETSKAAIGLADVERRAARKRQEFVTADLAGDVESRTRAITGGIGFVGGGVGAGIERRINIGAEALASFEAVGKLKNELPQLAANLGTSTLALGALGAGVAVAAVGFEYLQGVIKRSGEATQRFVEVNRTYAEIIAGSTTQEVEEAIKGIQERNAILDEERQQLNAVVQGAKDLDGVWGALIDVNDALGLNLGGYEDLKDALRDANTEYDNNIDLIDRLNAGLSEGETAAADYAVQLEEIEKHMRDVALGLIRDFDREAQQRTADRRRLLDPGDPEAVEKELEGLHIQYQETTKQIADLSAAFNLGLLSRQEYREEVNRVLLQQKDLTESMRFLSNELLPTAKAAKIDADAAAYLKQKQDELTKARISAVAAFEKELDAMNKATEAFERAGAEAEERRQIAILQEAEDYAIKQTRNLAKHYRDLAKLDQTFNDKREDILAKIAEGLGAVEKERLKELRDFNRESIRNAEDHARRLIDIERDSKRDIQKAALKLDAIGIYEAQKQAEEALRDEDDQYDLEKQRREEDFRDRLAEIEDERQEKIAAGLVQLEDLRQQHERERAERIADFQRTQQEEAADRALKLQRQREAWAREDQARLDAYRRQVGITEAKLAEINNVVRNGFETVKNTIQNKIAAIFGGGGGQTNVGGFLSGVGGLFGQFLGGLPQFQSGGLVTQTGPAMLHQGEIVVNPRLGGGMGAVTINAPITLGDVGGYSEGQISNMVTTGILQALREAAR